MFVHFNPYLCSEDELIHAIREQLKTSKTNFAQGKGYTVQTKDVTKKHLDTMPARWEDGNLIIKSLMNLDTL